MKAVVAAFNQEKALVGAFSVITNLRMELFQALVFEEQKLRPDECDHKTLDRRCWRLVLTVTSVLQMLESDEEDEAEQEFTVEIGKQELVTAVR